ncbi:efflux transporter outer membrane subunit [Ideonella livida]|uniref:Efflux transporter outer membrane subunit n=1 Tax=Ideonella livida TaxID=2707176 RepID=A0A7C9TNA0_9BURK|nr:efflux transporter outer membrane subunit [Ideonella livida]NDY94042.1 efflux transporter outer membrane subunit [Ideonella livida]
MNLPSCLPLAALAAAVLAGCAATAPGDALPGATPLPHGERPAVALPVRLDDPGLGLNPAVLAPPPPDWWAGFQAPALVDLMQQAEAGSATLAQALERLRQAELSLRQTQAAAGPSVGLSAGANARRSAAAGGDWAATRSSSLGLSAGYELDLWGRLAADEQAAQATVAQRGFDLASARLSLQASVATAWLNGLASAERLRLARDNLALAERLLAIVQARHRAGVATPLEVAQQQTTVLSQRAALLPLQLAQRQYATALALLLGRTPQDYTPPVHPWAQLQVPAPALVQPAELLLRRPDLAAQEAQLGAAQANVAAARAALLPSLSLSAGASLGSDTLWVLADPSRALSLGASLAYTLFDGGQRQTAVALSQSQRQVLVLGYGEALRAALKEVDDALGGAERQRQQTLAQAEVLAQARRALALAEAQYRAGSGNLQAVLEAQRTVFSAQDGLTSLELARLSAAVELFRALGGGWRLQG